LPYAKSKDKQFVISDYGIRGLTNDEILTHMTIEEELDTVLHLDSRHPCYARWRQYHLNDLARGNNIATFLSSRFELHEAVVLDVGSGLGGIAIAVAKICRNVIGIESNEEFSNFARRRAREMGRTNVEFIHGTGESLTIPTASVDLVIMNDVIEHFGRPASAIAEAARVLKPGGHVYVLAPNRHSFAATFSDPHYGLPFVMWLPQRWRDFCVRARGLGDRYDGNWFPSMSDLIRAFGECKIELIPVGQFDGHGSVTSRGRFFRKWLWGYPIYIGTKAR
jgi:SAM-dependent methyltransferase